MKSISSSRLNQVSVRDSGGPSLKNLNKTVGSSSSSTNSTSTSSSSSSSSSNTTKNYARPDTAKFTEVYVFEEDNREGLNNVSSKEVSFDSKALKAYIDYINNTEKELQEKMKAMKGKYDDALSKTEFYMDEYSDLYWVSDTCCDPEYVKFEQYYIQKFFKDKYGEECYPGDESYFIKLGEFHKWVDEVYTPRYNEYCEDINNNLSSYNKYLSDTIGMTLDEYNAQMASLEEDLLRIQSSAYALRQQEKNIPYMEISESEEYQNYVNNYKSDSVTVDKDSWNIGVLNLFVNGEKVDAGSVNPMELMEAVKSGKVPLYGNPATSMQSSEMAAASAFLKLLGYDKAGATGYEIQINNLLVNAYDYMTEEERMMYSYLFDTDGGVAADEYLEAIKDAINQRKGQAEAEAFLKSISDESGVIQRNLWTGALSAGKGVLDGIETFGEGLYNLFASDGVMTDNQYAQMYILEALEKQSLFDFMGDAYQLGSSFGNMLPSMVASIIISSVATPMAGSVVANLLMGASSAGNSFNQKKIEGDYSWKAYVYGLAMGVSETTLGMLLGNIPFLNANAALSIKGLLSEGLEEFVQTYVEAGMNAVMYGEDVDAEMLFGEASKSFIYGVIMSGITNGGQLGFNLISNGKSTHISNINDFMAYVSLMNNSDVSVVKNDDGSKTVVISNDGSVETSFVNKVQNLFPELDVVQKFNNNKTTVLSKGKTSTDTNTSTNVNTNTETASTVDNVKVNTISETVSESKSSVENSTTSSSKSLSDPNYLSDEVAKANYYTGKGNFYTIDVASFDGISSDFWSQINDPSNVRFRKDGEIYTYLQAKELAGADPIANMLNTKTVDENTLFEAIVSKIGFDEARKALWNFVYGNDTSLIPSEMVNDFNSISKDVIEDGFLGEEAISRFATTAKNGGVVNEVSDNSSTSSIQNNIDQQIANANRFLSKGNFASITLESLDAISNEQLSSIVNSSSAFFLVDGKRYTYDQVVSAKNTSSAVVSNNTAATLDSVTEDSVRAEVESLKYKKANPVGYAASYLASNFRKYLYKDTSSFPGLNEQIMQNGLYHFTTAADAILESGYIKASNMNTSYTSPISPTVKSFFFNGIPDVGAFTTNLDSLPLKATAVRVQPTTELVNDPKLKLRYADDHAITYDGRFNLAGYEAEKCYFCLDVADGKLFYRQVSEQEFNSYDGTTTAKVLSEYVSNKSNITAINADFFNQISLRNTNAKVVNSSKVTSLVDSLSTNQESSPILHTDGNNQGKVFSSKIEVAEHFNDYKQYAYFKLIEFFNTNQSYLLQSAANGDTIIATFINFMKASNSERVSQINELALISYANKFLSIDDNNKIITMKKKFDRSNSLLYNKVNNFGEIIDTYTEKAGPAVTAYMRKRACNFKTTVNGKIKTHVFDGTNIPSIDDYIKRSFAYLKLSSVIDNVQNVSDFMVKQMKNIIKYSPPLKESITVYRGVDGLFFDGNKLDLKSIKPGTLINDSAFLSTSAVKTGIATRNDIALEITIPKGTKAAYIESFTGVKNYGQQEILLDSNTTLRITSMPEVINGKIHLKAEVVKKSFLSGLFSNKSSLNMNNLGSQNENLSYYNRYVKDGVNRIDIYDFIDKLKNEGLLEKYNVAFKRIHNSTLYSQDVYEHNVDHIERVILYSLYMGSELNLSEREMDMLVDAAMFHDAGGRNGSVGGHEKNHGVKSAQLANQYLSGFGYNDSESRIIEAAIEYHQYEDNDITLKNIVTKYGLNDSQSASLTKIANILKDADALDRTRFVGNLKTDKIRNKDVAVGLLKVSYQMQEIRGINEIQKMIDDGEVLTSDIDNMINSGYSYYEIAYNIMRQQYQDMVNSGF